MQSVVRRRTTLITRARLRVRLVLTELSSAPRLEDSQCETRRTAKLSDNVSYRNSKCFHYALRFLEELDHEQAS